MANSERAYIYILECEDGTLYTGIAKDIPHRMEEHFGQKKACAKYTKSHTAKRLCMVWETDSWSAAGVLEYYIKTCTRKQKLTFIAVPETITAYKERLKGHTYEPCPGLVTQINDSFCR